MCMTMAEMEKVRDGLYWVYLDTIGTEREKKALQALDLMDEILDAVSEYSEDEGSTDSIIIDDSIFDCSEWEIDRTIDRMREEAINA